VTAKSLINNKSMHARTHHPFAFFRATFTCIRAFLAMIHFVLPAFLTASPTNFRAMLANMLGLFRSSRHERRCESANVRAISIQFDTSRHHFDVLFVQTCRRAMFARRRAFIARLDARFKSFVSHKFILLSPKIRPHAYNGNP
jgi:hypothetical protein